MVLDNEQQRNFLLSMLENAQFTGNVKQIAETLKTVNELGYAVQNAEIMGVKNGTMAIDKS